MNRYRISVKNVSQRSVLVLTAAVFGLASAMLAHATTPLTFTCNANTPDSVYVSVEYETLDHQVMTVSGGLPPYTYSQNTTCPATETSPACGTTPLSAFGLTLNPNTGVVTGTPTQAADFSIEVMDSNKPPYYGWCEIDIVPPTTTPPQCIIPPSGTAIPGAAVSWNKFTPVGSTDVVWINAHIGRPSGIPTNQVTTIQFTGVTFVLNGVTYGLPDGVLSFNPSAPATPTTVFDSTNGPNGTWTTTLNPSDLSDEIFFDGQAVPLDSNISGGGSATFNFTTLSNETSPDFNWQWSAAVYTAWPGNNAAGILPYHNSLHAGTPQNTAVQKSLIQGPRGGGGSNFTGSWSGTGTGVCP